MTALKIPLSKILLNQQYAIRVTSADQVKKLVPNYSRMDDIEMFFQTDKQHREFVGANHYAGGAGFYFTHPEDKQIIDYDKVEFDI